MAESKSQKTVSLSEIKKEKKSTPKPTAKKPTHVKLIRDDGKEFRVHVLEVENHMATGRFTKG